MRKRSGKAVLVVALVALSVVGLAAATSGCGDSKADEKNDETTQAARKPVPASLGQVESGAEDTIDFARQRERSKVVATARELRRAAAGTAAADLRKAGASEAGIAALRERARLVASIAPRAELLRVSLAANQVSALMPQFYALYSDPVPPDVLELDYLDREAQLRSLAGDRKTVPAAVRQLSSTWTDLRPRVVSAGGGEVAARFSRHVAAMRRLAGGTDQRRLQKEAVHGLALVDQLEEAFRK